MRYYTLHQMKTMSAMNKVIFTVAIAAIMVSACNKSKGPNATVIRECAGVFLKIDGKDYNVCNSDKLKRYPAGARIHVGYNHISECANPDYDAPLCLVGYPSEGWIEITEVK